MPKKLKWNREGVWHLTMSDPLDRSYVIQLAQEKGRSYIHLWDNPPGIIPPYMYKDLVKKLDAEEWQRDRILDAMGYTQWGNHEPGHWRWQPDDIYEYLKLWTLAYTEEYRCGLGLPHQIIQANSLWAA